MPVAAQGVLHRLRAVCRSRDERSSAALFTSGSALTAEFYYSTSHRLIELYRGPPLSWCVLSLVGEAIYHLLRCKSGDGKAAYRLQAVVSAAIDEILRSEDGSPQAASKFLKPR